MPETREPVATPTLPLARTQDLVVEKHDFGFVLCDTKTHVIYFLSPVALAVWQAADGRRTMEEITALVAAQHAEVSLARVRADLARLIESELIEPESAWREQTPPLRLVQAAEKTGT